MLTGLPKASHIAIETPCRNAVLLRGLPSEYCTTTSHTTFAPTTGCAAKFRIFFHLFIHSITNRKTPLIVDAGQTKPSDSLPCVSRPSTFLKQMPSFVSQTFLKQMPIFGRAFVIRTYDRAVLTGSFNSLSALIDGVWICKAELARQQSRFITVLSVSLHLLVLGIGFGCRYVTAGSRLTVSQPFTYNRI